jgi:DNA-binding transcriptional ArsR family regulator
VSAAGCGCRRYQQKHFPSKRVPPVPVENASSDAFQALAHPTRIAIIELLGDRELSAGDLIERLAIEQANVSQHLAVLRSRQLVVSRKTGNKVFYSIRDPILLEVLALMRSYFQKHLAEAMAMLEEINAPSAKDVHE